MRGYMFRNRWGALLFVGLTLASVTTLVGTEKNDGALQQAADQIAMQEAKARRLTVNPASTASTKPARAIVVPTDEELIDDALGEDPTPVDEFAAADDEKPAEGEQTNVIPREIAGSSPQFQPAIAPHQ